MQPKNIRCQKRHFYLYGKRSTSSLKKGELITSMEILDELKDDDLIEWSKHRKEFFLPLSKEVQEQTMIILKKYPTMIKMKSSSNSNGDPFLVATAIVNNGCIVTNERSGDEKTGDFHIPNVCKGFDIPFMDLHSFIDKLIS
jgi:hypothetical protein